MKKEVIERDILALGENCKTKDIDLLAKRYIKEKKDVSCLKDYVFDAWVFHRIYFQVQIGLLPTYIEKLQFIENNSKLLNDWWHTDQLPQFIGQVPFEYAYKKAYSYTKSEEPFLRRWGYVLLLSKCARDKKAVPTITKLLHDDSEYYVIMAEAWLICELATNYPKETYEYLSKCKLSYDIVGKAISKINDSFRVSSEYKEKFKELRKKYKNEE